MIDLHDKWNFKELVILLRLNPKKTGGGGLKGPPASTFRAITL